MQTQEDCRAEIERLKNTPDLHPMIRSALHDRALRAWLKIDSAGALAFAESEVEDFDSLNNEGLRLFRVWVDLDPESALEAQKITSPALAKIVHPFLLRYLAPIDPHRTLALLEELNIDRRNKWLWGNAESEAYRHWANDSPKEAIQHFLENNQLHSTGFLTASTLLGDWSVRDPEAAWEFYQAHQDHHHLKRHAASLLAINLLKNDPARLKDINTKDALGLAQKWAQSDLQGALDFAKSLNKDDPWYHHFTVSIAEKLAVSEPEKAIEMTLAAYNGPEAFPSHFGNGYGSPSGTLYTAFSSLQSTNPDNALDLLKSFPEFYYTPALSGMLNHEFSAGPEKALQFALKLREDPRVPLSLHYPIARLFEGAHPSQKLDLAPFVEHFPELRDSIKSNPLILTNWINSSPESAAAFIQEEASNTRGLEPTEVNNLSRALSVLTTSRPEFTSQWIHELPPGELQNNAAETLAANWSKYDPAATREWIHQLPEGALKESAMKVIEE